MLDALVYFVNWKLIPEPEIEALLRELASWGVSHLVFPPCWGEWEQQRPGVMQAIADKIQALGLQTPAAHALWGKGLDMSCLDPEQHRQMLAQHTAFLRALAPLGVNTYTVHPGIAEQKTTPEQWAAIRRSLDTLLPVAAETGIVLALENGHESLDDLRYLSSLVAEYRHENLGICFDSGHANSYSPLGAVGMVQLLSDQLVTCHLHDNYGTDDDHNPPGQGNIPWTELVQALKKCPNLRHAESEAGDWQRPAWEKFRTVWMETANTDSAI
jgi:sugar phosphate isomerase/epimerase